jgi:hypothetical protein
MAMMEENPDGAWTTVDLIDRVYSSLNRIEKKHRVAVLRVVRAIADADPDWTFWYANTRGGAVALVNGTNIKSYALGRMKTDDNSDYRSEHWRRGKRLPDPTEADLLNDLADSRHQALMAPGGAWHRFVAMNIARRDGDEVELARLQAE